MEERVHHCQQQQNYNTDHTLQRHWKVQAMKWAISWFHCYSREKSRHQDAPIKALHSRIH